MYNEHFQYGQRLGNSGFGTDSTLRPAASKQMAPRVQSEPLGASNPNSLIIQKIEALFPILEEMAGQNDFRANQIINKLLGLREDLDHVFG